MKDLDFLISFLKKFYLEENDDFNCKKIEFFSEKINPLNIINIEGYIIKEYHYESVIYWCLFEKNEFCGFSSFEFKNKIIHGDLLKIKKDKLGLNLSIYFLNELIKIGKENNFEKIIGEPDNTYMPHEYFKKTGWKVGRDYMEFILK